MTHRRNETCPNRLDKIPVELSVRVCSQSIRLGEFLAWTTGTVLTFDQPTASSLQLQVGQQNIATGRVVKLGPQLAFRVESLANPSHSDKPEDH